VHEFVNRSRDTGARVHGGLGPTPVVELVGAHGHGRLESQGLAVAA
jgi:hypothetical protein